MDDGMSVLGLATRGDGDRLSVRLVEVSRDADDVSVFVLDAWVATKGRDDASQLADVHDVLVNAVDSPRLGSVSVVAVKRPESPPSRPSKAYDRRTRFEAVAMLAAKHCGVRYMDFRKRQLRDGSELLAVASSVDGAPTDEVSVEALSAACAAISLAA